MLISLENVSKTYTMDKVPIHALKNASLDISAGDFIA